MAYDKNTWQSGDVVTSAKLNNIENGIANCNGAIAMTENDGFYTLQASYNDLLAMLDNGVLPFVVEEGSGGGATFLVPSLLNSLIVQGAQHVSTFGELDGFYADSADALMAQKTE